ncbi:sensor histidine kinase [Pendulispora albinea]|uniref:histidine kinase n=1 Tax=Pendulispora albinea TaxID=2741071 RepID=A0ABZ2LXG2_9BACT
MKYERWLIVLRPDGIIMSVSGGAPLAFVGATVEACDVAAPVKEAAAKLLSSATAHAWIEREIVEADGREIELLRTEAMPLRRSMTPLFDLLARTTETLMAQAHSTSVSLRLVVGHDLPQAALLDGEKIAWGIASLVGSALRYVSGKAAQGSAEERKIQVVASVGEHEGEIVLAVIDNGPGIEPQRLEAMLRRDPTTKRAGGLALVLLDDVVAAHGGRMVIESSTSALDHGTTVKLILPVSLSPNGARARSRRPAR